MKNYEITLNDGTRVYLTHLNQSPTYEGLLEGIPTSEMNQSIRKHALTEAKDLFKSERAFLVEPKEEAIKLKTDYPLGKPAKIPQIRVLGRLKSLDPVDPSCCGYSYLPVVWFQESFAFPICDLAKAGLQTIDWPKEASDWEY